MTDKDNINIGDICTYSYDNGNKSLCIVKIQAQTAEDVFIAEFLQVIVDDTGNDFFTYLCNKDKDRTMSVSRKYLHKIHIVNRQQAEIERLMDLNDTVIADLKYYLDTNEENGVVYFPKFIVEKILRNLKKMVGED